MKNLSEISILFIPIKVKSNFYRPGRILILAVILGLISPLLTRDLVYSQSTGAVIRVASGYPTELPADNQSETVLEVDYDNCSFGLPTDDRGNYSILASTSSGQIDPSFSSSIDGGIYPPPLTLKAGPVPGLATIDITVTYCPENAIVMMGVCTDPAYMEVSCTGSMTFLFVEPDVVEDNQDQPPSAPIQSDQRPESSFAEETKSGDTSEQSQGASLAELYDDLQEFLAGEEIDAPTPGQMAASGIALTTLLAGWLVLNQMAGVSAEKSLEVIQAWRDGERPPIGAEADIPTDFWDGGIEGNLPDDGPETTDDDDPAPDDHTPAREGVEDRVLRGIKDAQDVDDALKTTNKDIEAFEGKIPDQLKNSEVWKKHVGPKLKQAKDLLKKGELDKARTWLDRVEKIIEVRKDVDRDLDHLPVEQREGVVRLVQALKVGGHVLSDGFNASVIEPAKAYGSKFLPAEKAQRWEKAMDETGQAIAEVGQGIPKAVEKVSRDITHGEIMEQAEQMSLDSSPEIRKEGQEMKDLFKRDNVDHFDPWGKGTKKAKELWNHTMRALFHDR